MLRSPATRTNVEDITETDVDDIVRRLENTYKGGDRTAVAAWKGKIVPVKKNIVLGSRGGAYYVNRAGKKVYLKRYQKRQCLIEKRLEGELNHACQMLRTNLEGYDNLSKGEREAFIPKYARMYLG